MNTFNFFVLTFLALVFAKTTQIKEYSCMDQYNKDGIKTGKKKCCGIKANGKYECHYGDWDQKNGKYRYCSEDLNGILEGKDTDLRRRDLCCEAIGDCSVCPSFVVVRWTTQEELEKAYNANQFKNQGYGVNLSENWQNVYQETQSAFEDPSVFTKDPTTTANPVTGATPVPIYNKNIKETMPVGFISATLREFSDPPICVYVPNSDGRMVEIKAEPEENGNRLCVSDLKSDVLNRNEAGQGTPCDETRLRTCFADASTSTRISTTRAPKKQDRSNAYADDFTFYIFCNNEGCNEGGDVPLWIRARASKDSWKAGHQTATQNVEMWCQYVLDKYPDWDKYPSDLEPYRGAPSTPITLSGSYMFTFLLVFMSTLVLF